MPTALELGRDGWKRYIQARPPRLAPRELTPAEQRERQRLVGRVRDAAIALKTRFGVRRVILFGSLAHAAWFMPDSDVDMAVAGLSVHDYWEAWRLVEDIVGDRTVDLIELETASDSLRQAVQRYGVEL